MTKKMTGVFLLFICSLAMYGGIRFIAGVVGNAVLSLRTGGFASTEGTIDSCVIRTTGSGSGPRSQAGERRATSTLSYYHVFIMVNYTVEGNNYAARMFKNIFAGGYHSLREAVETIRRIAPGQPITWESYTEKAISRDEADYLCSLKPATAVRNTVSLKYDSRKPASNDLQVSGGAALKLFLGGLFLVFGAGMFFLLFRLLVPIGPVFQLLLLAGAVSVMHPVFGCLSSKVKTYREKHEKPYFVVHVNNETSCDAIKSLVKKQSGTTPE
jgi:hypothetical protein